jgi:hypothetical protein
MQANFIEEIFPFDTFFENSYFSLLKFMWLNSFRMGAEKFGLASIFPGNEVVPSAVVGIWHKYMTFLKTAFLLNTVPCIGPHEQAYKWILNTY